MKDKNIAEDSIHPEEKAYWFHDWISERNSPKVKYGSMLSVVEKNRIFSVRKTENGNFILVEMCDECFDVEVTSSQLRDLGMELIAIADGLKQVEKEEN